MTEGEHPSTDSWHRNPMKRRSLMNYAPSEFELVALEDLRALWHAPAMSLLRDLHRCHLLCGRIPEKIHFSECQYVKGVDYQSAVSLAVLYLEALPKDRPISSLTSAADLDSVLREGSAPAELALSFLTDPLTIGRDGVFGNGRHRAAAIIDAEIDGLIPVVRTP